MSDLLTPMAIGYCDWHTEWGRFKERKKGSEVGKEEAEDERSTDKSNGLLYWP